MIFFVVIKILKIYAFFVNSQLNSKFRLNNSFLENLEYFYDHTKQLFLNIDYRIQKKDKIFQINRSKELQELNDKSQNTFVIHGEGGCGKSALIKKFMDDNPKYIFLGMKAIELNNCNDLKETLHNCLPEKLTRFFILKKTWNGRNQSAHRMWTQLRLTLSKLFSASQITEIFCLP